jgi:hypothetical protein
MKPAVLLLNNEEKSLSKFGFEFTHLTATKLKCGVIEVSARWSCLPDFLKLFEVATEVGGGKDRGKASTTDLTYEEDIKNNVISYYKFNFEDAEYDIEVESPGIDPAKTTVKIIVALEQEGTHLTYVPMFARSQRYGCSVYFAEVGWDEYDEPFFEKVFEE